MDAREQYVQRLDALEAARLTVTLVAQDGTIYSLQTDDGWQAFNAACDETQAKYWRNFIQESKSTK